MMLKPFQSKSEEKRLPILIRGTASLVCLLVIMVLPELRQPVASPIADKVEFAEPSDLLTSIKAIEADMDFDAFQSNGNIVVRVWERNLFERGNWRLLPLGQAFIRELAHTAGQEIGSIVVEGHTDSSPFLKSPAFKNNISLSTIRAATVANIFVTNGISEGKLSTRGMGFRKPLQSELTQNGEFLEKAAAYNRRMEIIITN